jgi:hypothetical protein
MLHQEIIQQPHPATPSSKPQQQQQQQQQRGLDYGSDYNMDTSGTPGTCSDTPGDTRGTKGAGRVLPWAQQPLAVRPPPPRDTDAPTSPGSAAWRPLKELVSPAGITAVSPRGGGGALPVTGHISQQQMPGARQPHSTSAAAAAAGASTGFGGMPQLQKQLVGGSRKPGVASSLVDTTTCKPPRVPIKRCSSSGAGGDGYLLPPPPQQQPPLPLPRPTGHPSHPDLVTGCHPRPMPALFDAFPKPLQQQPPPPQQQQQPGTCGLLPPSPLQQQQQQGGSPSSLLLCRQPEGVLEEDGDRAELVQVGGRLPRISWRILSGMPFDGCGVTSPRVTGE